MYRFGWKIWVMATPSGELLACQPYAGAKTQIPDLGLGQGPNVVYGLAQQYGLKEGSKIAAENLFVNFDLLDHMADKGLGVVGTIRQNRLVGVPLPPKKEAFKEMTRGAMMSKYTDNICTMVWRDSQPVYLGSNFSGPLPVGTCERYGGKGKGYVSVPCPKMVLQYNSVMGGVDLLNQCCKNYAITTRLKKWDWSLYIWFLNIQMLQAWRLYRATLKARHALIREEEMEESRHMEEEMEANNTRGLDRHTRRKELDEERKRKRREEKKKEDVSLLNFIRETVELVLVEHSDLKKSRSFQREEACRLSTNSRQTLRFDMKKPHLLVKTEVKGVCQQCFKRSFYRCETCEVAVHPDCIKAYHVPM